MTTYFNLGSLPQTPIGGSLSSGPGTPMSGVSTVAIKDGHEGVRHSRRHQGHRHQSSSGSIEDGTPTSADRIAQLGGLYGPASAGAARAEASGEYFDQVSGWRTQLQPGEEYEKLDTDMNQAYGDDDDSGVEGMGGDSTQDTDDLIDNTMGNDPVSPSKKFKIPLPKSSPQIPLPPNPTPVTPIAREVGLSVLPSSAPGPKNFSNSGNASSSSTANSSSRSGIASGVVSSVSAPSPASTETTNSVRDAKAHAKMLGPITHDAGVVDTTLASSAEPARSSSSVERVLERIEGVDTGPLPDLEHEVRGEGSRKERIENLEERMVAGPPPPPTGI